MDLPATLASSARSIAGDTKVKKVKTRVRDFICRWNVLQMQKLNLINKVSRNAYVI
jgi:hypothetical protein